MREEMKSLQPTLKEKKRYITFEIVPISTYNQRSTLQKVVEKLNDLLGLHSAAKAGVMPVTYKNMKGIIKVSNMFVDEVKALIGFISTLGTDNVIVKTISTNGTVKKAKKHIKVK